MKRMFIVCLLVLGLFILGCASEEAEVESLPTVEDTLAMPVPDLGNEDIEEMIVIDENSVNLPQGQPLDKEIIDLEEFDDLN